MTYAIPTRAPSTRAVVPALRGITDTLSPLVEPALRIATGLMLVPHGAQKLFGWFGGYGVTATGQFFATKLGLPASLALIAGLTQIVSVFDARILRVLRNIGCEPDIIGTPKRIGAVMAYAALFEPTANRLEAFRAEMHMGDSVLAPEMRELLIS